MTSKQISFLVVILLIGGLIGFSLGKSAGQKASAPSASPAQANPLFRSQTATFQGEISKVNKDSLDVKTDSGKTGTLVLSGKVTIYKFKEGSKQATASSDLNSIEVGKKVLIVLEFSGGQYKVVSISYQPTAVITPTPVKNK